MHRLEQRVHCPYCGEALVILLDENDAGTDYIEDCQVCCQPMVVVLWTDEDGTPVASLRREDE
jgi:hypothetical protein